jgi:cytochrome oxidase Cu insertion factor (SCO1/SenC/PrrC family)
MLKKVFQFLLLVCLITCAPKEKTAEIVKENEPVAAEPVQNDRPVMEVTLVDGRKIGFESLQEKMVIILFQPDCDHCQVEARNIQKRLSAFEGYQLYFISSHPMEVINQFAKDYKLDNLPNVQFGWTSVNNVLDNFGAIAAPSIYIYTKEGKLVKSFNGQTDLELVINSL